MHLSGWASIVANFAAWMCFRERNKDLQRMLEGGPPRKSVLAIANVIDRNIPTIE